MNATKLIAAAPVLLTLAAASLLPASAQDSRTPTWPEVKCARYTKSWTEALARRGTQGLSPEFLASHEAFLASGCTAQADVCARSPQELELANIMVIRAMNAGTASTFLPFTCRK
jgi:hypothetical protein